MSIKPFDFLDAYRRLLTIRCTEETIACRYSEGKMRCPTHLSIGQEATAVGTCLQLEDTDYAVSTHRAHAHYIAKGGNLNSMIAEIYGKATGCSKGKGGSMHLIDKRVGFMGSTAIVGGTIPIGTGLALSAQLLEDGKVACTFLGDGAVEEGVFYESVNYAVIRKLPVVYICENNFYSVYSPLEVRQPLTPPIHERIRALGIATDSGDGNNLEEVFHKAGTAIAAARNGDGPVFLEFSTYRWREHCGPHYDNDLGYRSEQEFLDWKERDPVIHFERKLAEHFGDSILDPIRQEVVTRVDEAFRFAEQSPFPEAHTAFKDLYAV